MHFSASLIRYEARFSPRQIHRPDPVLPAPDLWQAKPRPRLRAETCPLTSCRSPREGAPRLEGVARSSREESPSYRSDRWLPRFIPGFTPAFGPLERSVADSPVEGAGFEPSVPLPRLSSIRAVRAEIIGRSTDVFRRDRECNVSAVLRHNTHPPISLKLKGLLRGIWCYRPW